MAGRPPWAQPGTQGGGQTVAVQNRPAVSFLDETQTGTVEAGQQEVVQVYAPTGSLYNVKAMSLYAQAPTGAATGSHTWLTKPVNSFQSMFGRNSYDSTVAFDRSEWRYVGANDGDKYPSNGAAQLMAMQNLQADEDSPLTIVYVNNTDVDQTQDRTINLVVEEVSL